MDKKTQEYLGKVSAWIQKSPEGSADRASVEAALKDAQRAINEVETLKQQLADKKKKRSLAVHVLEETFKAAKHARRAQQARDKANEKLKTPKEKASVPPASAKPTVATKKPKKA
ncbi:MAG: hypothetical protein ACLFNQ_10080 [Spirochaetaceae bacterium]